mmetsp:Transcript_46607/g.123088  ORF Transcript_46607/g.123088 Transcript_46607/m.123088 type:complete len:84 (-) Transcript_46607:835-1086(-)
MPGATEAGCLRFRIAHRHIRYPPCRSQLQCLRSLWSVSQQWELVPGTPRSSSTWRRDPRDWLPNRIAAHFPRDATRLGYRLDE